MLIGHLDSRASQFELVIFISRGDKLNKKETILF